MKANFKPIIFLFFILCGLCQAQQQYYSPEDVKDEWQDYTSFQRQELVNFSTFLYNEGFYERALLGFFQYLYRYPNDELELATYFQIAKCYENMENWDLAENYHNRILDESDPGSIPYKAARYQLYYISLVNEHYEAVIESTTETKDPYELIFRAYAHFESLEWEEARQAFKAAEAAFDHSHYSKQIRPWYKAIETAENAPLKEKTPALLSSLAPGGGFIYLKQTENAIGAMGASFLIYTAMLTSTAIGQKGTLPMVGNRQQVVPMTGDLNTKSGIFHSSPSYPIPNNLSLESKRNVAWLPPVLIAIGLYAGSMWKSVYDIDASNRKLVLRYTGRVTSKLPIQRFMDYDTPDFIIK